MITRAPLITGPGPARPSRPAETNGEANVREPQPGPKTPDVSGAHVPVKIVSPVKASMPVNPAMFAPKWLTQEIELLSDQPRNLTGQGVVGVAMSQSSHLMTISPNGDVHFFDLSALQPKKTMVKLQTRDWFSLIAMSPDGKLAVSGHRDQIWFWNLATGALIGKSPSLPGHVELKALRFEADGSLSASVIDTRNPRPAPATVTRYDVTAFPRALTPLDTRTVPATDPTHGYMPPDPLLEVPDGYVAKETATNRAGTLTVAALCSEDDEYNVSNAKNYLALFDAAGRMVEGPMLASEEPIRGLAFSQDGGRVITGGDRHPPTSAYPDQGGATVRVWKIDRT